MATTPAFMNKEKRRRLQWHGRYATAFLIAASLLILSPSRAWQNAPSRVPLSVIVTASEADARHVLDRLARGEDFAAVAKDQSTDPSASDGGYMGLIDPATLRPELRAAALELTPGHLSSVVKIPAGYAILKVLTQQPQAPSTNASPAQRQALSAVGAVRPTYDYAGFAAALQAVSRFPKPDGWDRDLKSACQIRTQALPWVMGQIEPLLQRPGAQPAFLRDADSLLADLHSYRGDFEDAIRYWKAAYQLALANSPDRVPQLEESLGIAYLQRAGEGLYKDFIFPNSVTAARTPQQTDDLKAASDYFLRYLKREPTNGEVRWLLNLASMLAGRYPTGVPQPFLLPPAEFDSKETVVRFTNVARSAGVARTGQAGGLIVDDFDNDGLPDIMISSVNDCEPIAFYRNNGDGTFTNRATEAGLAGETGGLNIIQADYNNDGCPGVLVLRGGWEYARPVSLLRNNCNGTFTDVTRGSGLETVLTSSQTAVWADIDNDGRLDLFIGNENAPAQLFLNKGDGKFVDIAAQAGVATSGYTKGVTAADYDNDGYMDLYVSALNGDHHLYHNNHDRTFTDVTESAGVKGPWTTFGAWFFDYDNDGLTDLFVAGYGTSVEDVMRGYERQSQGGETLRLFKNTGNGRFRDVTAETGLNRVFMPMGLNFGDIDNDGFLDFYLGSGNPSYASPVPNVLFHNDGGKRFSDITASSGTGVLPKGHGIAFADLDNDGDEDLFVVMGGAVPGDKQESRLFENPGSGNDWISLHLTGVKSNRSAIGARIKVTVSDGGLPSRSIYRTVGSGGSFGAAPLTQHIGLGKAAVIQNIEIGWPTSNTIQNFPHVAKNRFFEVREFSGKIEPLQRKSIRLGGTRP